MIFGKFSGIIFLNSNMFWMIWMWNSLCAVLCFFGHTGILDYWIAFEHVIPGSLLTTGERVCHGRRLCVCGIQFDATIMVWSWECCQGFNDRLKDVGGTYTQWTLEVLKMWNGLDVLEGGLEWAYEFDQRTDETDEDHFDEFWEVKGVTQDDAFVVKGMPCQRNSSAVF